MKITIRQRTIFEVFYFSYFRLDVAPKGVKMLLKQRFQKPGYFRMKVEPSGENQLRFCGIDFQHGVFRFRRRNLVEDIRQAERPKIGIVARSNARDKRRIGIEVFVLPPVCAGNSRVQADCDRRRDEESAAGAESKSIRIAEDRAEQHTAQLLMIDDGAAQQIRAVGRHHAVIDAYAEMKTSGRTFLPLVLIECRGVREFFAVENVLPQNTVLLDPQIGPQEIFPAAVGIFHVKTFVVLPEKIDQKPPAVIVHLQIQIFRIPLAGIVQKIEAVAHVQRKSLPHEPDAEFAAAVGQVFVFGRLRRKLIGQRCILFGKIRLQSQFALEFLDVRSVGLRVQSALRECRQKCRNNDMFRETCHAASILIGVVDHFSEFVNHHSRCAPNDLAVDDAAGRAKCAVFVIGNGDFRTIAFVE